MSAESSTSSAYARASCEYQMRSGLTAARRAATAATRSPARRRPAAQTSGIVAVPITAENARRPLSPSPKSFDHAHASR